ncbi:MAG: HAD family hydrolase [Lawsonibacter sp.]|jgi:HAD superfamily hydrolase (TIGR01509 family)
MRPDGAIFDLDGTLIDSMYIWDWVPGEVVRQFGRTPPPNLAHTIQEMGRKEAADFLISTFHLPKTSEQIMTMVNELVDVEYRDRVSLKPGVRTLLNRLSELKVPCAVATASESYQAEQALKRLGVWNHFRFAISSMQYGPKTGPTLYLEAARRLGCAPEHTLVFEDALHAARSARAGGFLVAGVFDPSAKNDQSLLHSVSHWYLPKLDDPLFLEQLR